MSEICLVYRVPVYVTVDTEARRVQSVEVSDTDATFDYVLEDYAETNPPDPHHIAAEVKRAKRIAERAEWPAWGWL